MKMKKLPQEHLMPTQYPCKHWKVRGEMSSRNFKEKWIKEG